MSKAQEKQGGLHHSVPSSSSKLSVRKVDTPEPPSIIYIMPWNDTVVPYSYRDGSEEKQEEAERQGAPSGTQNVPLAHGRNKLKKPEKGKGPQASGRLPGSRPQTWEPPRLPTRSSIPAGYRWGLRPSRTSAGFPGAADPPSPYAPVRRSERATLPERSRAQRTLPSRRPADRNPEPGTFPDQTGSRRNSRHGGPRPRHRPLARSTSKLVGLSEISREPVGPGR